LVMRDRFELMANILKICKNSSTKTHIKNSANLSSAVLEHYLDFLLNLNLIDEGNSYHTTEKGLGFISAFERLQRILISPF
jgi:predicted transcriptional regulator